MSKVVIFWPYTPKFFLPPFLTFLGLKNHFLDFIDLKNLFFRPENLFLDFLDPKISLNPLKTLRKHLFSLQIDEKNNIFLDFIAKNYPSCQIDA